MLVKVSLEGPKETGEKALELLAQGMDDIFWWRWVPFEAATE
jgi:hypothetical protein